ncbi:MAG TPA: transglutaminase domain-containing protein [Syntrophales bacterium]|nr:transglutaminase domain-containing protein [Syntrophales bacterium]
MRRILSFTALIILAAGPLWAENYTLKGNMDAAIRYELRERIEAGEGVKKLVLSFVVPRSFSSLTYSQKIDDFRAVFSPEPQERTEVKDKRGNLVLNATWTRVPGAVDVRLSCRSDSRTNLAALETKAPFPLRDLSPELTDYLQPTEQVQADNPRIRQLAATLTKEVKTEYDAVLRIVSWVVDNVRYVTPPVRYDALYSLETGKGNCQNYSHLSAALLRSQGIPTRIAVGVTLNQPYDIAWKQWVLTFKMGQGRHSWIEVWFPDLGWVPFDPQNSVLFVANRFLRIETGLDNNEAKNDGLMRWSQVPGAPTPTLQETINADFAADQVKLRGERESYGPKNLLLTPRVLAQFQQVPVKPPPPPPPPPKDPLRLIYEIPFLYGNLDYPENIDFAFPRGIKAAGGDQFETQNNFLVETAEYVTSQRTQYAQIFVLRKPVKLKKVGLALHNFGGDGWLWIDLFKDNRGKPGTLLATSEMIALEQISPRPGYRWEDFDFTRENLELMPGSYWIALGFTGSPIVNWFYTYGKPVGPVDGTRYKGVFDKDWSGALSYEFNYRIAGLTVK